ncbi:MAG: nuclear transport factor 2 family protein [Gaiellaceae bacterium]
MEHPHLDVVRAWFDAFERSDLEAAGQLIAKDGVLHVRQPIELAGDYVGLDAFLEFYRAKRARAGDGFAYRVEEFLAGDSSAAAILTLSSGTGGGYREWKQVAIYRIDDGRIVQMWFLEEDPDQPPPPTNRGRT